MRRLSQALRSRCGSIGTLLLIGLVILLGIVLYTRHELAKQEAAKRRRIFASQNNPEQALDSFFMNTAFAFDLARPDWQVLADYSSDEDLQWMRRHGAFLAARNTRPDAGHFWGTAAQRQEYLALTGLYQVGQNFRPIISAVFTQGDYAVVYYHAQNDATSMREAFLVNEGERWKIRRFLGARDGFTLMQTITVSKQAAGIELNEDEQQFVKNPAGYAAWKRQQLLIEAGALTPTPTPTPPPGQAPGTALNTGTQPNPGMAQIPGAAATPAALPAY